MPRKGENIYKRRDGRWEGRYIRTRTENGKAVYGYVYAKTYREVKKKLHDAMLQNVIKAESVRRESKTENNVEGKTVCSVAEEWLTSVRPQVRDSTYIKYRNLVRTYLIPEFQDFDLSLLTAENIRVRCEHLLEEGGKQGKGLSSKTVSDLLSIIRSVICYGKRKGYATICTGREIAIKQETKEICVLHHYEQESLCRYLSSNLSEINVGILVALFTGMRIGELCALRWEDISFRDGTIHVCRTMQRIQLDSDIGPKTAVMIKAPKSSCSIRFIPLPEFLLDLLKREFGDLCRGYLLTGSEVRYMEPRTMQNHFKRVLKAASVRPVNFHTLRHTFATRCIEVGFDIKSLSEILGHANVNITMNRYVHPTLEMKRDNMRRLSALFAVK